MGIPAVTVTLADDGGILAHGVTTPEGWVSLTVPADRLLQLALDASRYQRRTQPYRFTQDFVSTAISMTPEALPH